MGKTSRSLFIGDFLTKKINEKKDFDFHCELISLNQLDIPICDGNNHLNNKTVLDLSNKIENCDGIIIGTTENIGYMSGLTKDMFDRCYNTWINKTNGKPVCIYIRAGLDGTATKNSIENIVKSLSWRIVQPTLILKGDYQKLFEKSVYNLGGAFSAGIENNIF